MDDYNKNFERNFEDGTSGDNAEHSASIEMNETPDRQENIPSSAEVKIEADTAVNTSAGANTQTTSYTYSGSQLGDNAKTVFGAQTGTSNNASSASSGSYQSAGAYDSGYKYARQNTGTASYYNEHVVGKDKKRKNNGDKSGKKPMRYVAALLAAAVLNLSILGGAFALGTKFGSNDTNDNKTALSEQLKNESAEPSSTSGITNTSSTSDGTMDTTEIAKQVGPAIVGITSIVEGSVSLFGGRTTSEAQGSGIIISSDGYIVTNNHVVEDASSVTVLLNTGSEYPAEIIGTDEQTDLAVIKITPDEDLTVATLGDSTTVEVGETAIAIGNPMGLEFFGSVTQGIISAVNRTVTVDDRTMSLIQTDAAINSGNSGGALINSKGEVIGINTVKVSTTGVEGMGFAIPISDAKPIIADLLEYGYVTGRPVIGVSTRDVSEYMAQRYGWPQGAQIMSITTENAYNAGLQQGDIITKIDDTVVTSGTDLSEYKDTKSPGDTVTLEVYKYATGQTETVSVVLSEQTSD